MAPKRKESAKQPWPLSPSELNQVLKSIQDMVFKLVCDHIQHHMTDDDVQEMVQKTMIWLWEKSIPKYDPNRVPHVKISTFLYCCARNYILTELRGMARATASATRMLFVDDKVLAGTAINRDQSQDVLIEQAVQHLIQNPHLYLTGIQCRVFYAMVDNPNVRKKDLARLLGYKRASSFSMMIRRIIDRILLLDLEAMVDDGVTRPVDVADSGGAKSARRLAMEPVPA